MVKDTAEKLREPAKEAMAEFKSTGAGALQTVKEEGKSTGSDVADTAKEAAQKRSVLQE